MRHSDNVLPCRVTKVAKVLPQCGCLQLDVYVRGSLTIAVSDKLAVICQWVEVSEDGGGV